jgi:DNA-binding beta-propeller fold protein YncE
MRISGRRFFVAAAMIGTLAVAVSAPTRSAALSFCPPGSASGQCMNPHGLAVDFETGRLYVADRSNVRVQAFEADGGFLEAFSTAGSPRWVAVDNDAASASHHDVYVGTELLPPKFGVQKFDPEGNLLLSFESSGECVIHRPDEPIAVGPGGTVYVADNLFVKQDPGQAQTFEVRILKFTAAGACTAAVGPLNVERRAKGLAVDAAGSIYLTYDDPAGGIYKYDASGTPLYVLDAGTEANGIAVDDEGNLFASQRETRKNTAGVDQVIVAYDSVGNPLSRFGYDEIDENLTGLAAHHSALGDVFGSEGAFFGVSGIKYVNEPPPGPIVPTSSVETADVGNVRATLKAELNPEGKASQYRFEYVDQQSFETEGGFAGPATRKAEGSVASADFHLHGLAATVGCPDPLHEAAEGKCLKPATTYRFRIVAGNADGSGKGTVDGGAFTTRLSPELIATWVTGVGTTGAGLRVRLNPLGLSTSGYFEYVDATAYQAGLEGGGDGFAAATRVPAEGESEIEFGAGETPTTGGVSLSSLVPGTTYFYRVVATDPLLEGPLSGPAKFFRTLELPAGPPAPPCANESFRSGTAGSLPDCRAYEMVSPLEKANGDVIVRGEFSSSLPAVLEQSSLSGSKLAYGSYRAFGEVETAPFTSQYIAQRDPAKGWISHGINPARSRVKLIELDTELRALSPDLCDAWFLTITDPPPGEGGVLGYPNLSRRHDELCGVRSYEALTTIAPPNEPTTSYQLQLQGVANNGDTAIFTASDSLPGTGAPPLPAPGLQLYEARKGQPLRFVCLLPGEVPKDKPCVAGTLDPGGSGKNRSSSLQNAISANGQRIFWTSYSSLGPGHLYVRIGGSETADVSGKGEELSGTKDKAIFWGAAASGSKAIFGTGSDLYEFDVDSRQTHLIAHKSKGVLGMSEDAGWVYLASEEAIGGANAEGRSPVAGQQNLYLYHAGAFKFIMTLAAEDVESRFAAITLRPSQRSARVTADGGHAAFISSASPFGYDNTDLASAEPCGAPSGVCDAEVYRYDATGEALACVSCNPTGQRPMGQNLLFRGLPSGRWAAAHIPPWLNNLYGSRALSDDGSRLYFESSDALALRDTNGHQDVYQWEADGTGSCKAGEPSYVQATGGCLELVSSGQSPRDAEFVDAGPSGDDVFLATLSSLVPEDYGLVDIYDARVGGGFPSPPKPPPSCEGEACQSPPPAPEDITPSSASHQGPGNLGASAARCPKGKRKAHRGGKVRCVKKARRHSGAKR